MKLALAAVVLATLIEAAWAQSSLPDPQRTPGAVNPEVTQGTTDGWTRTVRPPQDYTYALKRQQIAGYADRRAAHYEEDHLIPLSLGGAPYDPRNLWPEPRYPADTWTADEKDELEGVLNHLMCRRRLSLHDAQAAIARNWEDAYTTYVTGEWPRRVAGYRCGPSHSRRALAPPSTGAGRKTIHAGA
ncbi:MAG TPA: hypothetical protein VGM32_00995 [Rhodopila sp.]